MISLFEQFLREKRYLKNASENTLRSYSFALSRFSSFGFERLNEFVISLRESELSIGACNVYIRSVNSFLTWAYENGHCQPLKIKQFKHQPKKLITYSDKEIKALISYKPTGSEKRLHILILLLADTGIRIEEALNLRRRDIDFDNLLLTVTGKGDKERIIPFSVELRKKLYKFSQGHQFDFVFCTRHGGKLLYSNVRRELNALLSKLGIKGSFHSFRRFFATNFIRQNGNMFLLQRLLGHASLSMTARYVKLVTDDLSKEHARTSILNRSL